MKYIILFFTCTSMFNLFSQKTDTSIVEFENNLFYHISNEDNGNLVIFLHGGVSDPYFKEHKNNVELNYILESNTVFASHVLKNGFDLLLPITNDNLNWLTKHEDCLSTLKKYLDVYKKKYAQHYIAGFSDGGTGSFKIFYTDPDYFTGLIVFNGYPFHKNFAASVNYNPIKDKKILFFGTAEDKVMQYEFMLTEYCKQKVTNPNTYLYVREGTHSFNCYQENEFDILFDILHAQVDNTKNDPIHAYIRKDNVLSFYEYRRSIYRKFGHGLEYYKLNKKQKATYKNTGAY